MDTLVLQAGLSELVVCQLLHGPMRHLARPTQEAQSSERVASSPDPGTH